MGGEKKRPQKKKRKARLSLQQQSDRGREHTAARFVDLRRVNHDVAVRGLQCVWCGPRPGRVQQHTRGGKDRGFGAFKPKESKMQFPLVCVCTQRWHWGEPPPHLFFLVPKGRLSDDNVRALRNTSDPSLG